MTRPRALLPLIGLLIGSPAAAQSQADQFRQLFGASAPPSVPASPATVPGGAAPAPVDPESGADAFRRLLMGGQRTPAAPPGGTPVPDDGATDASTEAQNAQAEELRRLFTGAATPGAATPGRPPLFGAGGPAPAPAPAATTFVLHGVVVGERTRMALLQPPGETAARFVRSGETVGAYRLTAVDADRVLLNGPDGDVVVRLGR